MNYEGTAVLAEQAFEVSLHGLLWLDRTGLVLLSNAAARQALGLGDGVRLRGGRLSFEKSDIGRQLESFLAGIDQPSGAEVRKWFVRRIDRPSGAAPLLLLAFPLSGHPTAGCLVVLEDFAARRPLDPHLCELVYGLTPAEIRIASRLLEGRSAPDIGTALSLSPLTVRTHMKRVFKKVGVRSQAQLMGALCRLSLLHAPETHRRSLPSSGSAGA